MKLDHHRVVSLKYQAGIIVHNSSRAAIDLSHNSSRADIDLSHDAQITADARLAAWQHESSTGARLAAWQHVKATYVDHIRDNDIDDPDRICPSEIDEMWFNDDKPQCQRALFWMVPTKIINKRFKVHPDNREIYTRLVLSTPSYNALLTSCASGFLDLVKWLYRRVVNVNIPRPSSTPSGFWRIRAVTA